MNKYKINVIALIKKDNVFILGKKKKQENHPLSGLWHIPGGKVCEDENEEDALKREMKEEIGVEIKVDKFLGERIDENNRLKFKWYLCSLPSNNVTAGGDLTEIKYVSAKNLIKESSVNEGRYWPREVHEYISSLL